MGRQNKLMLGTKVAYDLRIYYDPDAFSSMKEKLKINSDRYDFSWYILGITLYN